MQDFKGIPPEARQSQDLGERIRARIRITEQDCWEWQGAISDRGYGRIFLGSRRDQSRRLGYAHRVAYEVFVGPIPDGLELDHLCRSRSCCNPAHLEPVTPRENMLRSDAPSARQARQTHCKRGHEFTPENTYVAKDRKRYCRACRKRAR